MGENSISLTQFVSLSRRDLLYPGAKIVEDFLVVFARLSGSVFPCKYNEDNGASMIEERVKTIFHTHRRRHVYISEHAQFKYLYMKGEKHK